MGTYKGKKKAKTKEGAFCLVWNLALWANALH
jgi:hypothetical protein